MAFSIEKLLKGDWMKADWIKGLFEGNGDKGGQELPEPPMTAAEEAWDLAKTMLYAIAVALVIRVLIFQPFNIPSGSMKPNLLIGDFLVVSKGSYGYSRASLVWPLTRIPMEGRIFSGGPERGDVVVFKNRKDRNKDYIKRVIGLPGDEIRMIGGVLHVNGAEVERELIGPAEGCRSASGMAMSYRETLPNGVSYVIQECDGNRGTLDDTATAFSFYSQRFPDLYVIDSATPSYVVPSDHYFMMGDNRDQSQDSRALHAVGYVSRDDLVGKAERLFFSADGQKGKIWEFWNWPAAIRFGRIFDPVD